ncbi:cilia- and flagella-associated protein 157 [Centroberyx gerrardi]
MPKKKEKKSEDKKDEDRKSKKAESSESSDVRGKEFYQTQVRYLEEQLDRCRLRCEEQEEQRKELGGRLGLLQQEKTDSVQFLKRSVLRGEEERARLEERLAGLQRDAGLQSDALRLQLDRLRDELQDRNEQLAADNMLLAGKLADLEEFREQKERLMSDLESLEKQLANQKEEHSAAVYSLEKKALLENDRLKKEMHSQVASVAAELRRLSEQRMPETTARAVQENAAVRAQLGRLSEHGDALLRENEALRSRERRLRLQLDVLEPLLSQVTRKSRSQHKVVQQLTEKCQQLQAELEQRGSAQQEHQLLQTEHTHLLAELDTLRQDQASALEQRSKSRAAAERRGAELEEERRKRSRLESVLQEAASALRQALTDVPAEGDAAVRWNQMMQELLEVLDGSTQLGKGPAPSDAGAKNSRPHELQTCGPTPARAGTLTPVRTSQAQLPLYRPGDLGLVPRPTPKRSTVLSRRGAPSSRLLHSKPSSCTDPSAPSAPSVPSVPSRNPSTRPKPQ